MRIYANLLGVWTELTDDDNISGQPPAYFVDQTLVSKELTELSNNFVEVTSNNVKYYVHISCIQYTF